MPQTTYLGSRSLLITLTAWTFIVLAALLCAMGLVQGGVGLIEPAQADLAGPSHPLLTWVQGAGLMIACGLLVGAIGLMLRREWARRAVMVLLGSVLLANLAGLWFQIEFVQAVATGALQQQWLPAAWTGLFEPLVTAAQLTGLSFTLALSLGLGWMIRLLHSPIVRQEFSS